MAAEVSSLMRLLTKDGSGGGGEGSHGGDLVTRDLLGGCCGGGGTVAALPVWDGKELEIGLGSPSACENRLGVADLNVSPLCSSGFSPPPARPAVPQFHNLLPEHPGTALDLRLRSSALTPAAGYQSVCTLEKVRSALERAQREPPLRKPLPQPAAAPASPASSSTTTSSAKRLREATREEEGEKESKSPSSSSSSSSVVVQGGEDRGAAAGMAAVGCPICLLYVLISRSDPRCPRCNAAVPLPSPPGKKPRIDLNVATSSTAQEPAAAANPVRTVNFF